MIVCDQYIEVATEVQRYVPCNLMQSSGSPRRALEIASGFIQVRRIDLASSMAVGPRPEHCRRARPQEAVVAASSNSA